MDTIYNNLDNADMIGAIMFLLYIVIGLLIILAVFFTIEYGIVVFKWDEDKDEKEKE